MKLIKYTLSETGISKVQQKSEKRTFSLGRFLIFSSIIESNIFDTENQKQSSQLEEVFNCLFSELAKLWNKNYGFREWILRTLEIFVKGVESNKNVKKGLKKKLITIMITQLCHDVLLRTTDEHKSSSDALKFRVENDVDCLTLHIFLSEVISTQKIQTNSNPDIEMTCSWAMKGNYKAVTNLLKNHFGDDLSWKTISKPHSCIKYIIKHLANNQEDIPKSGVLNIKIFGFFSFQFFLDYKVKLDTIISLLTPEFMRTWMKNISRKNKNKIESFATLEEKFRNWLTSNADALNENVRKNLSYIKLTLNVYSLKWDLAWLKSYLDQTLKEDSLWSTILIYSQRLLKTSLKNQFKNLS